jgi:hypothetical protein
VAPNGHGVLACAATGWKACTAGLITFGSGRAASLDNDFTAMAFIIQHYFFLRRGLGGQPFPEGKARFWPKNSWGWERFGLDPFLEKSYDL